MEYLKLTKDEIRGLAEEIYKSSVTEGLIGNFYIQRTLKSGLNNIYNPCTIIQLEFSLDGYDFVRDLDDESLYAVNDIIDKWQKQQEEME